MVDSAYLDIDQILADEEDVNLLTLTPIANGESLEYSQIDVGEISEENELPKGSQVKCPAWLAVKLASSRMGQIQLPSWLTEDAMNSMIASPPNVNLRGKCNYFYEFGVGVGSKVDPKIAPFLSDMFLSRMKQLFVHLLVSGDSSVSNDFLMKLSNCEMLLHEKAKEFITEYKLWKTGKLLTEHQETSISRHKKLKRT